MYMDTTGIVETLLGIVTTASAAGLIITAKDFYKLKADWDKELEARLDKFVLKEVHEAEVRAIKEDVKEVREDVKTMMVKQDQMYMLLLELKKKK